MEWIDINDRLPEFTQHDGGTSDKVLITQEGHVSVGHVYKEYGRGEHNVWFTTDYTWDDDRANPTHWMPMPNPPKKQKLKKDI